MLPGLGSVCRSGGSLRGLSTGSIQLGTQRLQNLRAGGSDPTSRVRAAGCEATARTAAFECTCTNTSKWPLTNCLAHLFALCQRLLGCHSCGLSSSCGGSGRRHCSGLLLGGRAGSGSCCQLVALGFQGSDAAGEVGMPRREG